MGKAGLIKGLFNVAKTIIKDAAKEAAAVVAKDTMTRKMQQAVDAVDSKRTQDSTQAAATLQEETEEEEEEA